MGKREHFWVMHVVKQPFLTLPRDCAVDLSLFSWSQPLQKLHIGACYSSSSETGFSESKSIMGRWGRTPDNCFGDRRLYWPPSERFPCLLIRRPGELLQEALRYREVRRGYSSKACAVTRCPFSFLWKVRWSPCRLNWPRTQDHPRIK